MQREAEARTRESRPEVARRRRNPASDRPALLKPIIRRIAVGPASFEPPTGDGDPQYTPHVDTGDFVVIINADKIRVTGTKAQTKSYYRHSGFPGGLKSETFEEAMAKHPERVIEHAVKGMLPKNTLGRAMGKKLKVYTGAEHPHMAQQPREIKMEG